MLVWVCFSCSQCIICMRISTLTSANWYVPLSVTSNLFTAGQTPSIVQEPSKGNIPNAQPCSKLSPLSAYWWGSFKFKASLLFLTALRRAILIQTWTEHFTPFPSTWAGFANIEKTRIVESSLKIERVGCPRLRYYLVRMKRVFWVFRESVISKLYNEW